MRLRLVSGMVLWPVENWGRVSIWVYVFSCIFFGCFVNIYVVTTPRSVRFFCTLWETEKDNNITYGWVDTLYDTTKADAILNHIQHHTAGESAIRLCTVKTIIVGFYLRALPLLLCNITAGQRWFIDLKLTIARPPRALIQNIYTNAYVRLEHILKKINRLQNGNSCPLLIMLTFVRFGIIFVRSDMSNVIYG